MADFVGKDISSSDEAAKNRLRILNRFRLGDIVFFHVTRTAALFVLVLLCAIILSLLYGAWPAFSHFGFDFLVSQAWNPNTDQFGALATIYGTVITSVIAMFIAVPVGIGIAIFLTELCPTALRRPFGIAVELLAGIPSIIYGIWGFFVLVPVLQRSLQPFLIDLFGPVPILNVVFSGPPYGLGTLTAGLILAIMVLPFIASLSRDVFETVPPVMKEAAYGLGCTTWEVIRNVVIPHTRAGLVGGIMLSLGRALGETMAVTFVIGNAKQISASILQPGTTISATIALEYAEASEGLYRSSLVGLGLLLFMISFIVLATARLMLARLNKRGAR